MATTNNSYNNVSGSYRINGQPISNVQIVNHAHSPYTTAGSLSVNDQDHAWVTMQDMVERLERIEDRLCIMDVKEEYIEDYESLRDAYNHYKMMEKIILGKSK